MLFILALAVCEKIVLPQLRLHLPFIIRDSGGSDFLIQPEIMTDSSPVQENKAPEVHRFSPLCPLPDTDRAVFSGFLFFKLKEKITCGFLLPLLTKEIIFHSPVTGSEGIQTAGGTVSVQHKRNKALCGNGFSGSVLAAQEKLSVRKFKILFII